MSTRWKGMAAGVLLLAGGGAEAALLAYQANGVDLVYDAQPGASSTQGLTWTADANLFLTQYTADNNVVNDIIAAVPTITSGNGTHNVVTSDFNTNDGRMTWWGAMAWTSWLNSISYAGANDWRLWSALNSDGSGPCVTTVDCTDSELGHLFYVEGGLSAGDLINNSTALTDVFANMANDDYWSGTEASPDFIGAWFFNTAYGGMNSTGKAQASYGWAVRDGQIVDAEAPLPGTALLLALGLLVLGARKLERQATLVIR